MNKSVKYSIVMIPSLIKEDHINGKKISSGEIEVDGNLHHNLVEIIVNALVEALKRDGDRFGIVFQREDGEERTFEFNKFGLVSSTFQEAKNFLLSYD